MVGMVKTRLGNEIQFWTKVKIVGMFGQKNTNIGSFRTGSGTVIRVEQTDFRPLFDLEGRDLSDDEWERGIVRIIPESFALFVEIACSPIGVQKLRMSGLVMITPPLATELKRLGLWSEFLFQ